MRTNGIPARSTSEDRPPSSDGPDIVDKLRSAVEECPLPGERPTSNPWKSILYDRLHDQALPALITDGTITPAASLWTGSRLWVEAFRVSDLEAGDRLIVSLPPSAAFAQVLVAAIWEGYTIALAPSDEEVSDLIEQLDARAIVTTENKPHAWASDEYAGPRSSPSGIREASGPKISDVRFLLRTSGTTGHARWIGLSDRNVLAVLASHIPHFSLRDARTLSVLPWSHAFGLVLDFFPALLSGSEIIRDPKGGRDPSRIVELTKAWGATHLSAVPLTVQRLLDHSDGPSLLRSLDGGVIGGAPISGPLADQLRETSLRVGYGQTEASPGIALGPPGKWDTHYLGRPVGCSVDVADDGELLFTGPNACAGIWRNGAFERTDPDRSVSTGDLVRREGNDLYFQGRKDSAFKLSNGRLVQAGSLESTLKSRYPGLQDALVFTPNGDDVAVALCRLSSQSETPSSEEVEDVLGSLSNRLVWTPSIDPDAWKTVSKGSVDRSLMTERLSEQYRKRVSG